MRGARDGRQRSAEWRGSAWVGSFGGRGAGRARRVMGVVGAASRGRRAGAVRGVRVVEAAAAATAAAEDVGRRRRWRLGIEAGRVGYRWPRGW